MTPRPLENPPRFVFRAFGTLPRPVRRWLVRRIRPSWTAGSVAIIERDDGRWLFVRPVYRKGWTLPGGLVDQNEHPGQTVIREMKEELGIDVHLLTDGWVILDPVYNRLETVYRVGLADGVDPDAIAITTVELVDLAWFRPEEPPELEEETHEVLALVRDLAAGGPTLRIRDNPDR